MSLLIPPFAYASTFYRFKYFFSLLKKREPQIVADVPHRINKINALPILIIFKDADHFPCELLEIEIFIDKNLHAQNTINQKIASNYWDYIWKTDVSKAEPGWHNIDVKITYKLRGKIYTLFNDNYRTTSHAPFPSFFSEDDLPILPGFIGGDMHSHSNNTDDQIEFGASLEATAEMSSALGLDFFAVTDHSYDLDDYTDNFLKNDPTLKKWHTFLEKVSELNNSDNTIIIIPGEEVSVKNTKNQTVHLLVYNDPNYFPGCGDSGEKWLHYFSELSIKDVLSSLAKNAISFASHPTDKVPFMHRLLLNRGHWGIADAEDERLTGVQIFNGHGSDKIEASIKFWTTLLLKGHKSFLLAGNDGHGNFGSNRYLSVPFLKISETYTQLFGKWRTDLNIAGSKNTVTNIIKRIIDGNFSVSNGPAIDFQLFDEKNRDRSMGTKTNYAKLGKIHVKSSREFGPIRKIIVYRGILQTETEDVYLTNEQIEDSFELQTDFEIKQITDKCYFRAEIQSEGPKGKHFAFTNPIWVLNSRESSSKKISKG